MTAPAQVMHYSSSVRDRANSRLSLISAVIVCERAGMEKTLMRQTHHALRALGLERWLLLWAPPC